MKTLFTLVTIALLASEVNAEPPVTKYRSRRGLFGYKTVTQTNGPSSIVLNCIDPGLIGCKTMGITVVGDDGEISLSESDIESIEQVIDKKILSNSSSGTIVYDNKVVVTYWFKEGTDELSYTLYSLQQARRYGISY